MILARFHLGLACVGPVTSVRRLDNYPASSLAFCRHRICAPGWASASAQLRDRRRFVKLFLQSHFANRWLEWQWFTRQTRSGACVSRLRWSSRVMPRMLELIATAWVAGSFVELLCLHAEPDDSILASVEDDSARDSEPGHECPNRKSSERLPFLLVQGLFQCSATERSPR